jgi:hypothetical protein
MTKFEGTWVNDSDSTDVLSYVFEGSTFIGTRTNTFVNENIDFSGTFSFTKEKITFTAKQGEWVQEWTQDYTIDGKELNLVQDEKMHYAGIFTKKP